MKEWLTYPATKTFFNYLVERREQIKEQLLTTNLDDLKRVQGYAEALLDIIKTDVEDIEE